MTSVRALWRIVRTGWAAAPRETLLSLTETLGRALSALTPLFLGLFVGGAVAGRAPLAAGAALGLLASVAVQRVLEAIGAQARFGQMQTVGVRFDAEVARLVAAAPTLDHLDDAEYLDRTRVLRDHGGMLAMAGSMLLSAANDLVWSLVSIGVAAAADPRLLLLVPLGIPQLVLVRWMTRWDADAEAASGGPSRTTQSLLDGLTAPNGAAELRVFGLRTALLTRIVSSARAWRAPLARIGVRAALVSGALSLFYFAGAAAVLGWMIADAAAGSLPVASVVVGLTVVRGLQQIGSQVVGAIRLAGAAIRNGERLLWLEDRTRAAVEAHRGARRAPSALGSGIRLDHVSYSYPGAEEPSLDDVSLELPSGTVVAVVGENGAGKSTLVALLTGMRDPSAGRVLVDGTDLSELDLAAWRQRSSGAFQDHADFQLVTSESVGVGDLPRLDDRPAVRRALERGTGADVVAAFGAGLDTPLGASLPGGVEPSGGQWQRLAISRAMMRPEPLLLVLDEPTSALDAATEHALFESYVGAARAAGGRGAITVLVTHRFSTVGDTDLVVVLDRGRVSESGTHAELLASGGAYAELYRLQARGYA